MANNLKVADLSSETLEQLDAALSAVVAESDGRDYKEISPFLRNQLKTTLRRLEKSETPDGRERLYEVVNLQIWDASLGETDGKAELEAETGEPVQNINGLGAVLEFVAWNIANFHGEEGVPEAANLDSIKSRLNSLRSMMGANKGESMFRVRYQTGEGAAATNWLVTAHVRRQDTAQTEQAPAATDSGEQTDVEDYIGDEDDDSE